MADDEAVLFTVGDENPFVAAVEDRDPGRRLRGRLVAPVTVWTASGADGPVGLTVSSVLMVKPT